MIPALILAAAHLIVQSDSTIDLTPRWKVGDTRKFSYRKEKLRSGAPANKSRTPVEIEVLEKLGDGYVLRWRYGRTEIEDVPPGSSDLVVRLANLAEGLTLRIKTNSTGQPIDLVNADAVAKFYAKAIGELREWMMSRKVPQSAVEQLMRGIEPMMSVDGVKLMALQDASILFYACGRSLAPGEAMLFEASLPNIFGGEPFPSRGEFVIKEAPKGPTTLVEWRQTVDPEKSATILRKALTDLLKSEGKELPLDQALGKIEIENRGRLLIEIESGWPRSVVVTRKIVVPDVQQSETLVFESLAPSDK